MLDLEMRKLIISCWEESLKTADPYKWAKLTFFSSELFTGDEEKVLPGALAMELFALAADIFDDIQDQDNHQMPWRKIPFAQAISLANCLLFLSYQALLTIENTYKLSKIVQIFNETGLKASQGQYKEFEEQTRYSFSIDEYIDILAKKSGSFAECACKIGGILAEAPQEAINDMGEIGTNIGIIAQISNDLRDITDFENKSDFVYKKKTLPFLYLINVLEKERAEEFANLIRVARINQTNLSQKEQESLLAIIKEEGAIHFCLIFQDMFRQKALKLLEQIQVKEEKRSKLEQLINVISQ